MPGERRTLTAETVRLETLIDSVRIQFIILIVAYFVAVPLELAYSTQNPLYNLQLFLAYAIPLILKIVLEYILLYRHWSLLQGHGARTTAGKAVLLRLIPLFDLYWNFVALFGLVNDTNQYLEELGIGSPRMSRGVALTICGFYFVSYGIALFLEARNLLLIPRMVLFFIFYFQQRACVLAILNKRLEESRFVSAEVAGFPMEQPALQATEQSVPLLQPPPGPLFPIRHP